MNPTRISVVLLGALVIGAAAWYTLRPVPAAPPAPPALAGSSAPVTLPITIITPSIDPAPRPMAAAVKATPRKTAAIQDPANIPFQRFHISARRDTVLHTAGGCTLRVPAQAFTDAAGQPTHGPVSIRVKEVLRTVDYVLGNMTTVFQGRPLESGGSFMIQADMNGQELMLASGKALDMAVPTLWKKPGMAFFPGTERGNTVEWADPVPLETPVAEAEGGGWRSITYEVVDEKGVVTQDPVILQRVSDTAFAEQGLWDKRPGLFRIGDHSVRVLSRDSTLNGQALEGRNTFQVDPTANYIFQVKRLGWANIDRLLQDKRTRPVDLLTHVDNADDKEQVYISMVVRSHRMYLPGYRKADGSFSFSHGDHEAMRIPIGVKAIILATAQRDGKPWYAMQEITLSEKGLVELHLEPTTREGLQKTLLAAL